MPTLLPRGGALVARLVLLPVSCLLVAGGRAEVQPAPVSRLECGGYQAVPSGMAASGRPSRLGIQRAGRLMVTVADWSITRVGCSDMDADKTFELLVSGYSGGAHCCETLHVFALGEKPQKLLEYPAGNAGGYEVKDLDGDGRQELVLGDDSFAYFGDLSYAASPRNLPLVACRVPRGFEECTRRFPGVVRDALARYTERLRPPADTADAKQVQGDALGALAAWTLLGEDEKGLQAIAAAVSSEDVMRWLDRARPQVRDWVAARAKRIKDGR
jgi:hypothetical protein